MIVKHSWMLKATSISFLILIVVTFMAPIFTPYEPQTVNMSKVLHPPDFMHLFGTDELGRDVLSRLLHGGQVSLLVGATAMFVSIIIGVSYGAISGFVGGFIDRVLMRFLDACLSIPSLILMIGLQLLFSQGLITIIFVISLTSWMPVARMIRTEIMVMKNDVFIQASKVVGATPIRLLYRHLLPQCWPTITIMAISGISHAILAEATLSFLGIGIPPHEPSWGNMLMDAQSHLLSGAWWLAFFPAMCIIITILAITSSGELLQDRFEGYKFRQVGKIR
ncbi:ABC transporter permease [Ureibacillus manganicus]|uniref:ABC transporter permease n=1 Tax=Ureibacillus manganicus TaxID=1266064 RepID=UPI000B07319B|nr:ABC transporter permease [Ureibacillus manganicus]